MELINNCPLAGVLGLTNVPRTRQVSQWCFHCEFCLEDILILALSLSEFSHNEVTNDFNGLEQMRMR